MEARGMNGAGEAVISKGDGAERMGQTGANSTYELVLTGLFTAIILIMAFVPNLGYINLVFIKATLIHIPVIIGSLFLGPKKGAFLGGVFGLTSFINNTMSPSAMSFAFSPVVAFQMFGPVGVLKTLYICFVPRILIGVGAYFVFAAISRFGRGIVNRSVAFVAAGAAGAMINTALVMSGIYFLYAQAYAEVNSMDISAVFKAIMGVVFGQGVLEAVVSAVIVGAVATALSAVTRRKL